MFVQNLSSAGIVRAVLASVCLTFVCVAVGCGNSEAVKLEAPEDVDWQALEAELTADAEQQADGQQ